MLYIPFQKDYKNHLIVVSYKQLLKLLRILQFLSNQRIKTMETLNKSSPAFTKKIPINAINEYLNNSVDNTIRELMISADRLSIRDICFAMIINLFLLEEVHFDEEIVEKIVSSKIVTPEEYYSKAEFQMLKDSSACVAFEICGMIQNQDMKDYAASRGGNIRRLFNFMANYRDLQ